MARFRKETAGFEDYYEMLVDTVRNEAYALAIKAVVKPGDVVVDLGAGLGFLSFLAAKAGASKVYAVEQSNAVRMGRAVAAANGLDHIVEFVQMSSVDFDPGRPVDVIVSETLGSFAVDENTLRFTIDARDRLLAHDGRLVPRRLKLLLAPIYAPERREMSRFWAEVEGVDFTVAVEDSVERMALASIARSQIVSPAVEFADIDLMTVKDEGVRGEVRFPFAKRDTLHGIGGWFEAELADNVTIRTSPHHTPTHWSQVIFPFRRRLKVAAGDHLTVALSVEPDAHYLDDVSIAYEVRRQRTGPVPLNNDPCHCGSAKRYKKCCRPQKPDR